MFKAWLKKKIFRLIVRMVRWARNKSLKDAVKKANQITSETGKTCLIYFIHGQYEVYEKRDVKRVKKMGHFKELTMAELLRKADIYTMRYHKKKIS